MKKFLVLRISMLLASTVVATFQIGSMQHAAKPDSKARARSIKLPVDLAAERPGLQQTKPTPDPREEITPPIMAKNTKVETIPGKDGPEIPFARTISPKKIVKTNKPSKETEEGEREFSDALIQRLKEKEARKLKIEARRKKAAPEDSRRDEGGEPKASFDIDGGAGSPPDNTVAVSENGYIVSADNGKISFYRTDGTELDSFTYPDFLSDLDEAEDRGTSDPKVVYDPEENRFIFCIQFSGITEVALAFSTSEDPREDWNLYFRPTREGDTDGLWFDFPSLSVNYHEVFLAGNIFNEDRHRVGNLIMAIDKDDGYAGRGLTWRRFSDITPPWSWNTVGQIFAVGASRATMYGPGHYFVSTTYSGGSDVYLFHITDHLFNDPELKKYTIDIADYEVPASAAQPDTDERLDTADCRITGAYYHQRKIYFVFTKDDGHGYGGVAFYRLRLRDFQVKSYFFHDNQNSDYSYPTLCNRRNYENYSRAVIAYLRSGPNTFPQIRMRMFNGSMEPIARSTTIKRGESFRKDNKPEKIVSRWGDYIGIQREYGTKRAWMTGHTANADHKWRTRLISIDLP